MTPPGPRAALVADARAALVLLAIAVPEQLATSRLAGMPPFTGYEAFIAGSLAFAFLGSNRQLSVGADSTIAPLLAAGAAGLAPAGSARNVAIVGLASLGVGALVILAGVLRIGWIAEFLSTPIITGFLAGVAVVIAVHQLPDLLGTPNGHGSTLRRVGALVRGLDHVHPATVALGLGVLALVVSVETRDRRLPAALGGLAASTAVVAAFGLAHHGVAVVGSVRVAVAPLSLAGLSWSVAGRVLGLAAVVALVVISQTSATTRAFADLGGFETDVNRDFVGVGAGSLLAGLLGSFAVDASPPRTAAVADAGGRTRAAGLLAALALAALTPFAFLLRDVPVAALAAVLLFVAGRLLHVRDLVAIARFSLFEFLLSALTLVAVAFVGVEQGIGVAVALAIVDRAWRSARPQLHVLGRIPATTSWAPLSSPEHPEVLPGVLVVLFATPLWYANAGHFRSQFTGALAQAGPTTRAVVLDAIGMFDIDFTGCRALGSVLDDLERRGVALLIARAGAHARASLERGGLLARIGPARFFSSVDEAVASAGPLPGAGAPG